MQKFFLWLTAMVIAIPSTHAAELAGEIETVDDKMVTISSAAEVLPKVGDRFEVFFEIPVLPEFRGKSFLPPDDVVLVPVT